MTNENIEKNYNIITFYYKKFLKQLNLKLLKLKDSNGKYIKNALVLAYLTNGNPKQKWFQKKH